jgi:hypothetical protein
MTKKTSKGNDKAVGISVGLGAAVAAAAGAYLLYGSKSAAKNRKTVKSWMLKAKAEVLETIEKAQDMTQEEYEQMIDTVTAAYKDAKSASKTDLVTFKKEMKEHWGNIAKLAAPKKKAAAKKAPAKKVAVAKAPAKKVAAKKVAK